MNKKHKNNIVGIFFTVLVIGLLVLSGPASAIGVDLTTPDIDLVEGPENVDFTIQVQINDGEFLPLSYTDLILDYGDNSLTCKINNDNTIDNCDFLTVTSKDIEDLYGDYGYGYGYGYGYDAPNYGYGYDFGYGYGYGYDNGLNGGYGTITYTLSVDVSELPLGFLNEDVNVEARVYGGTEDNWRYFKGTSSFNVNAEKENIIDRTQTQTATYPNVVVSIPANSLPADVTKVNIKQVAPTANPTNTNFKLLGKVYDFDVDSATKTFSDNLQVTLTYTDQDLVDAGITDEGKIYPAFYNIVTGDWEQLNVVNRMPNDNKLTFQTNHFTQFALLADLSVPTGGNGGGASTGGGSGGRRTTPSAVIPTPTPTPEEVTPTEEVPTVTAPTPEGVTQPTGLTGITGAVVGALGTGGAIVALILAIGGVGAGSYFLVRKKKK